MKFALTLGAAFAALTLAAYAHSDAQRIFIRHGGGGDMNIDADNDGWVTRTEASAAADRVFDQMDTNDDGQLNGEDRASMEEFNIRVDGPDVRVLEGGDDEADDDDDDADGERHVTIIRRGDVDDERIQVEVERAVREAEQAAEEAGRRAEQAGRDAERAAREAERRAERAEREAEQAAERAERDAERAEERAERAESEAERNGERHVSREVIIVRGNGGEWTRADGVIAPVPPVPAVPAVHPPMFMMLIANSEEADLNGDGALSRDEFRAQHLRFFDASDANGDGRVRFEAPPIPPEPPTPPAPPAPPAPPRHHR